MRLLKRTLGRSFDQKNKEAVCSCISTFVSYFFVIPVGRIGLSNISKTFLYMNIIQLKITKN